MLTTTGNNDDVKNEISTLFIGLVEENNQKETTESWNKQCSVKNEKLSKTINFKIDAGAQANTLLLNIAQALNAKLVSSPATLVSYSGHQIRKTGQRVVELYRNDVWRSVTFELVDESLCSVL